ncbi:hypothetical protein PICMEDRAFT_58997 [Pichia membranifaciens NRRL Y-2026]|uniref:Actin interacting protein 3 C-terminal domain-containing protein n=1 Tax=Pichia membranifaciens NRRL Y-2026 TaxID=763406 RepID=A0A1E3NKW7_9ASCO|nr:hypothetical protein PICMEDRAFT_58997 [Pichia membranifaciens NRRL Y-2026]ODQ46769.1 hypothetical protein PICMEDRAFT_58997 [Pichia membranifaciens NRRL Y-2026]
MSETDLGSFGRKSPTRRKGHVPSIATATSHLLTATKALLQSLTSWSQNTTSVSDVSSRFVKFGDAYKSLKRSYSTSGVDVTQLPDIPGKVRLILEASLVMEPSQESLDKFLPQIGDSVAELMKMLKEKQNELNTVDKNRKNGSISASSSILSFKQSNSQTTPTTSSSGHSPLDFNRTPSKDPITRLQNNNDLMRRASKRFSAYQTSSIISMQSPMSDNIFNAIDLPKTPLQMDIAPNITAEDLEKAKNSTKLDDVDENETKRQPDLSKVSGKASTNNLTALKEETLSDTAKSLTGGQNHAERNSQSSIFLKLGDQVKKVSIDLPTTFPNLKVLFSQRFNYSSPATSSYPKIYIQDGPNLVAYELENISEIKYGSIISLQQPDFKSLIISHVDSQIGTVKNDMMNMEDRILKKLEKLQALQSSAPATPSLRQSTDIDSGKNMKKLGEKENHQKLFDDLQDELTKVKQHQIKSVRRINGMINSTVETIDRIQADGLASQISENTYVKDCKAKVSEGCESLVEKLDDLQDVIEFIKRDITKHNIKPSDKQLEHLSKEMKNTKAELSSLTDYTQIERKNLLSMWSKQMATISADQRFFKAQEEIMGLLAQDYQSAQETFDLIVSCATQLEKGSLTYKSKLPVPDPSVSPWDASKLVMAEVDAINPNHEERVEAIMKAERVREMEKELRLKDEFQEELGDFVSNEKLKRNGGGISEIEKQRQEKDQEHMKSTFGIV